MATVTSFHFQNHCFLCLELYTTPKHPASSGNDSTSKIVNIQPLLRYLAGADPIAANPGALLKKKIPLLNNANLPPFCKSCNDMLLELQRLHQSLLEIQLLIQTETVKMRKVIESASSTKAASSYISPLAKFCGVIESSQMPVGMKQGIVQLVKDFRETVKAEGASSVKFPSFLSNLAAQPIQLPLNFPLQLLTPVRLVKTPVPILPKPNIQVPEARTNKRKQKLQVKILDLEETKPDEKDHDDVEDDTETPEVEMDVDSDVEVKSEESESEDPLVTNDPLSDGSDDDDEKPKVKTEPETLTPGEINVAPKIEIRSTSKGFMPCFICPLPKPHGPIRMSEINDHIKEHLGRDGWTCPSCHKIFPTRTYLYHHLNIRNMGQCRTNREKGNINLDHLKFTCSLCTGLEFKDDFDFFKHVTETHERDPSLEKSPNLRCKICELQFRTEDGLQFHLNSHVSSRTIAPYLGKFLFPKLRPSEKFFCDPCGKHVAKEALSYHLKTAHLSDDHVKCVLCEIELKEEKICKDREDYFQHLIKDHKGGPKPCHVCWTSEEKKLEQFRKLYQLRDHLLVVHKLGQEYLCELCNGEKSFHTQTMLREHMNVYHRDKSDLITCDLCLKSGDEYAAFLRSEDSLNRHMEKVHPWNKFQCERCPSLSGASNFFRCKFELTEHEKECHKEEPLVCSISSCLKKFDHQLELKFHVKRHQEREDRKSRKNLFKCPHCNKGFESRGALKRHEPAHSKETPFICAECGKGFRSKDSLKTHEKTHLYAPGEKPRPHVCEYCSRAFTERELLVQHTRIHTGERPFICDICGDRFRQSQTLRTHLVSHKKSNFRPRGTFERGSKRRPLEN